MGQAGTHQTKITVLLLFLCHKIAHVTSDYTAVYSDYLAQFDTFDNADYTFIFSPVDTDFASFEAAKEYCEVTLSNEGHTGYTIASIRTDAEANYVGNYVAEHTDLFYLIGGRSMVQQTPTNPETTTQTWQWSDGNTWFQPTCTSQTVYEEGCSNNIATVSPGDPYGNGCMFVHGNTWRDYPWAWKDCSCSVSPGSGDFPLCYGICKGVVCRRADCPDDQDKTEPGICGCGEVDDDTTMKDSDSDNVPDCIDYCPNDPNKVAPGICGCGKADGYINPDYTVDCLDNCPNGGTINSDGRVDCLMATSCTSFTNDEANNHFTADCSSATTHDATCTLTVTAGYSGGSVTCDTSDGQYDVVPAAVAGCTDSTACNYNSDATNDDGSCISVSDACDTCSGASDGTGTCNMPVNGDLNDNGVINIQDVVMLIDYVVNN